MRISREALQAIAIFNTVWTVVTLVLAADWPFNYYDFSDPIAQIMVGMFASAAASSWQAWARWDK